LSSYCLLFLFFFTVTSFSSNKALPNAISLSLECWVASFSHMLKANPEVCSLSVYGQFDWPSNRHSPTPTPHTSNTCFVSTQALTPKLMAMEIQKRDVQLFHNNGHPADSLLHCFRPEQASVSPYYMNTCTIDICFNFLWRLAQRQYNPCA
jgi:hypothetical protein